MENIALAPNIVFTLWGKVPITSSHITLWVISLIIIVMSFVVSKNASIIPSGLQMFFEGVYVWFEEKISLAFSNKKLAAKIAPMIISFFIVILFSNNFGVLPVINNLVVNGEPLMKTPTSHLSMTLALTLIALIVTHITAFSIRPLKYVGNYIKIAPLFKARSGGEFAMGLLDLFLGILDIVGELAKIISLSCRLFGNVLAGELMAIVVIGLSVYTQFVVPIPFIVLSLFSGVIQAAVFALLSLNYISLAVASVEE